jgi:hypothetical protein
MDIPENAPTLTKPLCLGSSGDAVRALQTLLNDPLLALGHRIAVDGRFGKVTHVAVVALQRRKGLKPDGVVGQKTAKILGFQYQTFNEKPYTLSYETPPLPASTPPLAVLVEAIRLGMDKFCEKLADDMWLVYSDPNDDPAYQRLMGKVYSENPGINDNQFSQRVLRIKDLIFEYNRFLEVLSELVILSGTDPQTVPTQLQSAFKEFIAKMLSACDAMDFYYGITEHARKRLKGLPYESIVGKVENFLKGERAVAFAVAEIQIVFQPLEFEAVLHKTKVAGRPSLDWMKNFQYDRNRLPGS